MRHGCIRNRSQAAGDWLIFRFTGVLFRIRPRPKNVPVPLVADGDSPIFAAITLVLKADP